MSSDLVRPIKTLAEVMTASPLIVDENLSVLTALDIMRRHSVSSILVGPENDPRGILTERDVVRWLRERLDLSGITCGMVMHHPLATLPSSANYLEAHHEMKERGFRHLGITAADGQVVGIVSESDILHAIGVEYFTQFKSVGSLMVPARCLLPPDATVGDAIDRMDQERQGSTVVVDDQMRPVGILTERDIVRLTVGGLPPLETSLREVATRPVRTVPATCLLHDAVATMEGLKIRNLVVVDDMGRVSGLLSQHEVVGGLENHYIHLLKDIINKQSQQIRGFDSPVDSGAMMESLMASSAYTLSMLTDHDFRVMSANPGASMLLGLGDDEVVGANLADILDRLGTNAKRALAAIQVTGHGSMTTAFETGDTTIRVELRVDQLWHPDRGVQGYLVTAHDLSERDQVTEALLAERDFSDGIIAGLPGLFYLVDKNGGLERFNAAWTGIAALTGVQPRRGMLLADALALHSPLARAQLAAAFDDHGQETEIALPVIGPDGHTLTYLHKLRRVTIGRHRFHIGTAFDITQRQQSLAEAERLARLDSLTGLSNRHHLIESLEAALERSDGNPTRSALLFLDLDNFKTVNDSLGHVVGDRMLGAVAERLRRHVGDGNHLARLGGDEFAVLMTGDWADGAPEALADRLIDCLRQPFGVDGHHVFIGASVGIVSYPGEFVEPANMLAHADMAMYRAKSASHLGWCRFEPWMAVEVQRRRTVESALRQAVALDQFELHYQPKLALSDLRITGAEALIRWRQPELGMVPPDEFIAVAEATGFIANIGNWVLDTACREAKTWLDMGYPLKIAVNVSPVQFLHHNVAGAVRRALAGSGLPPEYLEIEITETAIIADYQRVQTVLDEITAIGVRVAMDDFGTGYSSLAQLQRLRFHTLKIDKSFVLPLSSDGDAKKIAETIIALGQALGMTVVAEGIETDTHLDLLRALGCDEGQGFLFWRPLPPALFRAVLEGI